MITFSILLTIAIVIVSVVLAFGTGFLAVFGDLIICGLIIGLLVKLFKRRK